MKFHISSIFIGIGQAILLCVFFWAEGTLLQVWAPHGTTEVVSVSILIVSFVLCVLLALAYPIYLLFKKRNADAIAVFLSTAVSIGLVFVVLFPITREQSSVPMDASTAIAIIQEQFPEFNDYPNDGLPPRLIRTEEADNGWYVAFVQEGSGRPIISVRCYFVDTTETVTSTGMFSPQDSAYGIDDISLSNCQPTEQLLGGDRDEHGCIGSAGYAWCAAKNACLRPWEEPCEESPGSSVCSLESCHDFQHILCGSNPPDVCTEIYMVGDRCLQYADCGVINGTCEQRENAQFDQCASCVQQCIDANPDDAQELFACESACM